MEKSNLEIEPFFLPEALALLNKNLEKKIRINHLYNVIYNKLKPELIYVKGRHVMIQYNEIVNIYNYIKESNRIRYSTNGRKKKA